MAHQPSHLLGALHEDTLRRLLEVHAAAQSPLPPPPPPPLHLQPPSSRPSSSKRHASTSNSRSRLRGEHFSSPSPSSPAPTFSSTNLIEVDQERRDLEARTLSLRRALLRTHFHIHEVQDEEPLQPLPLPPPPPQPPRASTLVPPPLPTSSPPLFDDDVEGPYSDASYSAIAAAAAAAVGWGWAQKKQRADRHCVRVLEGRSLTRWLKWLLHRRLAKERENEIGEAMTFYKQGQALARFRRRASNSRVQHMAMLRVVLMEGGREGEREGGREGEQEQPLPSFSSSVFKYHQLQQEISNSCFLFASLTTTYTRAALRLLLTRGFHRLHRHHVTSTHIRSLKRHAIQDALLPSLLRKGLQALRRNNKQARRRLLHKKAADMRKYQQLQQQQRALQQWCAWRNRRRNRKLLMKKGELWWDLRLKEGGLRRWGGGWCEARREGRRLVRGMDAWHEQRLQQRGVKTWLCMFVVRREERRMLKRGKEWREGGRMAWGKWCRVLGRMRGRRSGEKRLARAAGRICERRRMKRALVVRWRERWMLGVKEKERARGRKGEGLWRGRAGGRAVEALRAWAARRMLRQALEKAQRGGEEELQAGSALPWRVMQLLKKCEGWKVIVEEEKGYRALLVRGEEHFESRGEERGILAWVAYVVALKMQRAALKRVERSMDPRCHRQQEQQEEQQQEEQQLSALSPRLPSASFLPSLPPPHLLHAAYTRLAHRRLHLALDRWKFHSHQQGRLSSSLVRAGCHYLLTQWQGLRRALQQQERRETAARMAIEKVVAPHQRRRGFRVWLRRREERERGREWRRGRVEGFCGWRGRVWTMRRLREMVGRRRTEREREGRALMLWEGGGEGKMRRRWRKRKLGRVWRKWHAFREQQHLVRCLMLTNKDNIALAYLRVWRQALQEKELVEWQAGALHRWFHRWYRRAKARAARRVRVAETVGRYVRRVRKEKGLKIWRKWMEGRRRDRVVVGERMARVGEGGRRMKVLVGLRRWKNWVAEKQRRRKESEEREGFYCRNRLLRNAMYGWREKCRGRGGRQRWMLLAARWYRRRIMKEGLRERWGAWVKGKERRERKRRTLKNMEERARRWRERRWVSCWQRWRYSQEFVRGQEEMAVEWERRRRIEGGRKRGKRRMRRRMRNVEISGRGFISLLQWSVLLGLQQRQAMMAAEQARELILASEGWRRWVCRVWIGRRIRVQENTWKCWERDRMREYLTRWRKWVRQRKERNLVRSLRREVRVFRRQQQQQQEEGDGAGGGRAAGGSAEPEVSAGAGAAAAAAAAARCK